MKDSRCALLVHQQFGCLPFVSAHRRLRAAKPPHVLRDQHHPKIDRYFALLTGEADHGFRVKRDRFIDRLMPILHSDCAPEGISIDRDSRRRVLGPSCLENCREPGEDCVIWIPRLRGRNDVVYTMHPCGIATGTSFGGDEADSHRPAQEWIAVRAVEQQAVLRMFESLPIPKFEARFLQHRKVKASGHGALSPPGGSMSSLSGSSSSNSEKSVTGSKTTSSSSISSAASDRLLGEWNVNGAA